MKPKEKIQLQGMAELGDGEELGSSAMSTWIQLSLKPLATNYK